jgi:CheY-like chemotaxis protein
MERRPNMATILLVDDAPECAKPLAHVLRRAGHDVACATNGLEALTSLDAVWPDMVVTDLTMPVMDGLLSTCAAWLSHMLVTYAQRREWKGNDHGPD